MRPPSWCPSLEHQHGLHKSQCKLKAIKRIIKLIFLDSFQNHLDVPFTTLSYSKIERGR